MAEAVSNVRAVLEVADDKFVIYASTEVGWLEVEDRVQIAEVHTSRIRLGALVAILLHMHAS